MQLFLLACTLQMARKGEDRRETRYLSIYNKQIAATTTNIHIILVIKANNLKTSESPRHTVEPKQVHGKKKILAYGGLEYWKLEEDKYF